MRFLLVDRVSSLELGRSISGHKNWSMADDVFNDHFPGTPVVPGVLLVESIAQLLGFLLERSYRRQYEDDRWIGAILSIIHRAKFRQPVLPGDRVDMKGEVLSLDERRASGRGRGYVDGVLRVEAELSFVWHRQPHDEVPVELTMQRRSYEQFVFGEGDFGTMGSG